MGIGRRPVRAAAEPRSWALCSVPDVEIAHEAREDLLRAGLAVRIRALHTSRPTLYLVLVERHRGDTLEHWFARVLSAVGEEDTVALRAAAARRLAWPYVTLWEGDRTRGDAVCERLRRTFPDALGSHSDPDQRRCGISVPWHQFEAARRHLYGDDDPTDADAWRTPYRSVSLAGSPSADCLEAMEEPLRAAGLTTRSLTLPGAGMPAGVLQVRGMRRDLRGCVEDLSAAVPADHPARRWIDLLPPRIRTHVGPWSDHRRLSQHVGLGRLGTRSGLLGNAERDLCWVETPVFDVMSALEGLAGSFPSRR